MDGKQLHSLVRSFSGFFSLFSSLVEWGGGLALDDFTDGPGMGEEE
jgi:hypothetical protein